jgi:hypothetical protein
VRGIFIPLYTDDLSRIHMACSGDCPCYYRRACSAGFVTVRGIFIPLYTDDLSRIHMIV